MGGAAERNPNHAARADAKTLDSFHGRRQEEGLWLRSHWGRRGGRARCRGTMRGAGGIAAAGKAALGRGVRTQGMEATQLNRTWLNLKF